MNRASVGMFPSAFDTEEDHFRRRLNEINKEMQSIIERTSPEIDPILRVAPVASAPLFSDSHRDPYAAAATVSLSPFPTTKMVDESYIRRIVSEESCELRATLQRMVSESISAVRAAVSQRLDEARQCQSGLSDTIAAEAAKLSQRSRAMEDSARAADAEARGTAAELARLRDAVAALQNNARVEEQRGDRRVDELVRRHHELVRNSLLELDARAAGMRDEFTLLLRTQSRQALEERDAVQQHVARLQGALDAVSETTARCVAELRDMMEDSAARRSEVRSCRRDVNRLEMILYGESPKTAAVKAAEAVAGGGGGGGAHEAELLAARHKEEGQSGAALQELRERVSFLTGRVEATERQVVAMDGALRWMMASRQGAAQGIESGNPRTQHQHHHHHHPHPHPYPHDYYQSDYQAVTAPEQRQGCVGGTGAEGPFVRSVVPPHAALGETTQMRQPYLQQQQPPPPQQQPQQPQQQQQQVKEHVRYHRQHEQITQQRNQQHQQHQYMTGDEMWWNRKDCAWSSTETSQRHISQSSSPEHQVPIRTQEQHQFQQHSKESEAPLSPDLHRETLSHLCEPPVVLDSTRVTPPPLSSSNLSASLPRKVRTPTPSDSYVSENDTEKNTANDNVSRKKSASNSVAVSEDNKERYKQYIPAPTSDVESELANAKLARLALD